LPAAVARPQRPAAALPSTTVEIAVAEIWRSLLNLDQIHVTDNFFDLGGHSLLAMRAANEIRRKFGIDPHLHHLIFENLGQVAGNIEKELATAQAPSGPKRSWWNAVMHRFAP
jgi:hypothetical protein